VSRFSLIDKSIRNSETAGGVSMTQHTGLTKAFFTFKMSQVFHGARVMHVITFTTIKLANVFPSLIFAELINAQEHISSTEFHPKQTTNVESKGRY
jgi:ABC-type proline/glycine betaine transport system permease subunit